MSGLRLVEIVMPVKIAADVGLFLRSQGLEMVLRPWQDHPEIESYYVSPVSPEKLSLHAPEGDQ